MNPLSRTAAALIPALALMACAGQHPPQIHGESTHAPDAQAPHEAHWAYEGEHGPGHWAGMKPEYALCGEGKIQSPIDISGAAKAELPAITYAYQPSKLRLLDNGHTIQVNYDAGSHLEVGGARYDLAQFHFHKPSEEQVNGRSYEMVAHLVHRNARGELAVVAVLFEKGAKNPFIGSLWSNLPDAVGAEQTVDGAAINVRALLPEDKPYWTFAGSLTTPPCSEGVTWFVLQKPVQMSAAQIEAFGRKYAMNARPVQPLNGRVIRSSR